MANSRHLHDSMPTVRVNGSESGLTLALDGGGLPSAGKGERRKEGRSKAGRGLSWSNCWLSEGRWETDGL